MTHNSWDVFVPVVGGVSTSAATSIALGLPEDFTTWRVTALAFFVLSALLLFLAIGHVLRARSQAARGTVRPATKEERKNRYKAGASKLAWGGILFMLAAWSMLVLEATL